MKIQIKPITKTMNELSIVKISVVADNSAQALVVLSGDMEESKLVDITPEEYAQWGSDDNYIADLVLSKLGLEKNN